MTTWYYIILLTFKTKHHIDWQHNGCECSSPNNDNCHHRDYECD